jgi:transmembrane sensor
MNAPNHPGRPSVGDDRGVQQQAHAWVVHLTSGAATQDDARALAAWRSVPEHDAAFRAAAGLWKRTGDALADTPGPAAARRGTRGITRRRMLGRVAAGGAASASIAAAGATLALQWPALWAAYRTGTGEIRTVTLPGGTRIELDAETAMDAYLDQVPQNIALYAGAVAITVPANHPALTLGVGEARLVTEPNEPAEVIVRCRPGGGLSGWVGSLDADMACLSGAVTVIPAPGIPATRLAAGQEIGVGPDARGLHAIDVAAAAAWRRGLLVFRDTPLAQVVDDLNRYRPGRIVVASSTAAARRVTGVFHLSRPEEALSSIRTALALSEVRLGDRLVVLR